MNRNKKIAIVAAGASVAVAGLGTAAYAYWTTGGSSAGTAGAGDAVAVTVEQVGTVTGLVPGGAPQAVDIKVTNTQSTPQYVTTVTYAITSVTKDGASVIGSCGTGNFDVVQPTWTARDLSGSTTVTGGSIAMKNLTTNQDACKGVTVGLTLTAA